MRLKFTFCCILLALAVTDIFACTTAIVTADGSQSGRPMIWKQRDNNERDNVVWHGKGEKYSFTAIVMASALPNPKSAFGGANEVGFAIANNNSITLNSDTSRKSSNGRIIFEALSRCATLDEFEDMAKIMADSCRIAGNFAVIDAKGGAAYFEIGNQVTRYDVMGTWDVRTNFSLSGPADAPTGLARYETATEFMTNHKGKFLPEDLIDGLGRSFYNSFTQTDAIKDSKNGIAMENECIARYTTVSSFVIEGVTSKDAPNSSLIWCAIGYTPACYAVPIWVSAGNNIPVTVSGENGRRCMAERLGSKVNEIAYDFPRDKKGKYIRTNLVNRSRELVRRYEKTEFKEGRSLDKKFRKKGAIEKDVVTLNSRIEKRFQSFRKEMDDVITKSQAEF